jgi:threonylcarbamoyladenosine tRNA methylthiotransferase MtaB
MTAPREPEVLTFGCRLNLFESEVMRAHARAAAGREHLVIVNSCAVTAEAERQVRQAIRKARREHPAARIVVTGCAAQISPERFAAMPEVDRVVGNAEKLRPETWLAVSPERVQVADIGSVRETAGHLVAGFAAHTRAFLQVQNGCDHRCTFCVIPYGRGPSRSVALSDVVAQVECLVADGVREVVLTGVDVTAYGADLDGRPSLGALAREILVRVRDLPRLRLSSLDPVEIDDDLWRLLAEEPRLMPHLHLSLQAGDDAVLKRMKRRHLRADALACAARARALRPDVALGADLIAGFPTETEETFARTLDLVEECGLVHLHVFPYSERPGTPAARMPAVPVAERRERAARLRSAGERAHTRFLASKVGRLQDVLIESDGIGRTPDFALVEVAGTTRRGAIVTAEPHSVRQDRLLASLPTGH